ncbi:MAG: hypothetical protein V3V14_12235 [Saprospiraceae bacterium]
MAKYYYLNLFIGTKALFLPFVTIITSLIAILLGVDWWMPVTGIVIFSIIILSMRIGTIEVKNINGCNNIYVKDLQNSIILEGPFECNRWWSYNFGGEMVDSQENETTKTSKANTLNVFLLISDKNKNEILFKEKIVLDARFPNEVNYSQIMEASSSCMSIVVQRTDKLYDFLLVKLGEDLRKLNI